MVQLIQGWRRWAIVMALLAGGAAMPACRESGALEPPEGDADGGDGAPPGDPGPPGDDAPGDPWSGDPTPLGDLTLGSDAGADGLEPADTATAGDATAAGDEATAADSGGDPETGASTEVLYPVGEIHSPITAAIAERLRGIGAGHQRDPHVFAKIGDSNSAAWTFLYCYAESQVSLGGHAALAAGLAWFRDGEVAGTTPFDRASLAAVVGQSSADVIAGAPSLLDQELAITTPRSAIVLLGTNDLPWMDLATYARTMWELYDRMLAAGVVPVVTTLPARADPQIDLAVPRFNAVLRGLAEGLRLPLLDLHAALQRLPNRGLRADGVHLSANWDAALPGSCDFSAAGMIYGVNVYNLVAFEALDRVRRAVDAGEIPDAGAPTRTGDGSAEAPYELDGAVAAHLGDLATAAPATACGTPLAHAATYALTVTTSRPVRLSLVHPAGPGSSVWLTRAGAADCIVAGAQSAVVNLPVATYRVVVGGDAGEYLLVVE